MRMRSKIATYATAVLLLTMAAVPGAAVGEDDATSNKTAEDADPTKNSDAKKHRFSASEKAFDAVLIRPFDFCGFLVSSAAFVPAALMTSPTGRESIENAYDLLVREPKENVFDRPLGEI